jgi:hypothetical protein
MPPKIIVDDMSYIDPLIQIRPDVEIIHIKDMVLDGKEMVTLSTTQDSPGVERHILGYLSLDENGVPVEFRQTQYQDMTMDVAKYPSPFAVWLLKDHSTLSGCGEPSGEVDKKYIERVKEEIKAQPSSPVSLENLPYGCVSNFARTLGKVHSQVPWSSGALQKLYSGLTETQKKRLLDFIASFDSSESDATT